MTLSFTDASVVLVLQNAFRAGLRDINLNTNYLVVFGQFRDRSTMSLMAKQIMPGEGKFLQECYNRVVDGGPYKYLFLNLHPRDRTRYWLRSSIFSDAELYLP